MKFKLDECLDVRLTVFFADAGHDIQTIYEQALAGKSDDEIYSVCIEEGRTLVTQDMDFSSPFRFSPLPSQGIIVLKNPSQLLSEAKYLICTLIEKIETEPPRGHLWVVGSHGIRVWPAE